MLDPMSADFVYELAYEFKKLNDRISNLERLFELQMDLNELRMTDYVYLEELEDEREFDPSSDC